MRNATIKGLLAHKLRLALTALSVVLGVAFVSGTYVLTDTINHTFDQVFADASAGIDVTVRARSAFGEDAATGATSSREPLPMTMIEQVRRVDGVDEVDVTVSGFAQLIGKDGEAVGTTGAPTLGYNWPTVEELSPLDLRAGRAPERDGEVIIDARTARDEDFNVGDRVRILLRTGPEEFTIVGTAGFGEADNLAGATLAAFELSTAQRVFDKQGVVDTVDVTAEAGVSALQLRDRLEEALPDNVEAVTGEQVATESANAVKDQLGFFSTALLTFAAISLFVGAFIIFNTFSILVAQRTRELALLRALGASRRQVTRSVLTEAAIVGVFSSAVGLGLGVLVAIGLQGLLKAFGIDLPSTDTQFQVRTVIASVIVGVGVTLVAAVGPARRASRVPPMAALRDEAATGSAGVSLRRRGIAGAVIGVAGMMFLLVGLSGGTLPVVGLGALLTFLGVAIFSPLVATPLARAIGAPLPRFLGVSGKLGRQNAMRNPRRTAATAAALMIGLGLVGCVSVMSSSVTKSTTEVFDRSLTADFTISTSSFMPTISPAMVDELARQPEIGSVTGLAHGEWRLGEARKSLYGVDPAAAQQVLNLQVVSGDYASLARGDVLVAERVAEEEGWTVGDVVPMTFSRTGTRDFRIGALFGRNELLGSYVVSNEVYGANFTERLEFVVLVKAAPGVGLPATRAAVERVTEAYPNVTVRNQAETKEQQREQLNSIVGLVSALLGLAIVIALLGIVNTLALSVFERTRELGLLRAVGMSRRQVRTMVRGESVITAVMGAVLGIAVGVLFGWALVSALSDEGISDLVIPSGRLLLYVVLAAIAGVVAAVWPARRAARLDVLGAISHE